MEFLVSKFQRRTIGVMPDEVEVFASGLSTATRGIDATV